MTTPRTITVPVPGTAHTLTYRRDAAGRLLRLDGGGRVYLQADADGPGYAVDGDLMHVGTVVAGGAVLRRVHAAGQVWAETYRFDARGRLAYADGTAVERDAAGRVTACVTPDGTWRYRYRTGRLAAVVRPDGTRRALAWDADGRPHAADAPAAYAPDGRRTDVPPPPATWHRDDLGRLWAVVAPDGRVRATYLWDGFTCLGRIDGPPGAPMAVAFTCDPSFTPVRLVTRASVVRVPRDAFGEGLLAHAGVPGLYGGAVHGGFVHYRFRALDPRLGVFDRPDPWDGGADDPRRHAGFGGPLATDAAGPYAVGRHDAVGHTDPLGASSTGLAVLVHLASLTWSMQNNILGVLGLDLTVNWWGSLFTGFQFGNFFEYGAHTGQRQKTFAIRRNGITANPDRAWTYQHILWARGEHIDENADVHVVDPEGRYVPSLYGTVLHVRPQADDDNANAFPFLLTGDRALDGAGLRDWTRAGGIGEGVFPGSSVPYFARGGFHLDAPVDGLRAFDPMPCTLAELEPTETLFTAVFTARQSLTVPRDALAPDDGSAPAPHADRRLVLLTDAEARAGALAVERVEAVGGQVVLWLTAAPTALDDAATPWRARTLEPRPDAGPPTEDAPVGPEPTHLNVAGSAATHDYDADDPVRFLDPAGGAVLGAGLVARLETQLTLASGLPADLAPPLAVQRLTPAGTGTADLTADGQLENVSPAPPGVGCFLQVTGGGTTITAQILEVTGTTVRLDPDVGALGAAGDAVTWAGFCVAGALGTRADALDAGALAALTYAPDRLRTAPPAGDTVLVSDAGGRHEARAVQAVAYDAAVFRQPLPAAPGATVRAERYAFLAAGAAGHLDVADARLQPLVSAPLDADADLDGDAVGLVEVAAASLTAAPQWQYTGGSGTAATNVTVMGGVAVPAPLRPTQLVVLAQGGVDEQQLIRRVSQRVTFDRVVDLNDADGLELVRLGSSGPAYEALIFAPDRVRVSARAGDPLQDVHVPHLRAGELVVLQAPSLGPEHVYRVAAVETHGSTLTLADGPPAGLPASTPAGLRLRRLVPARRWFSGTAVLGADGHLTSVSTPPPDAGNGLRLQRGTDVLGVTILQATATTLRIAPTAEGLGTAGDTIAWEGSGDSGQPRLARGGRDLAVAGGVSQARFDVWRTDDLGGTPVVAVVSAADGAARPARVTAAADVELAFARPPSFDPAAGAVEIRVPDVVRHAYAAAARRVDGALVLGDVDVAAAPGVVAVYGLQATNARDGRLSPGTTLVPNDPDDTELKPMELDRRQSLIDHELRHTEQSALLGPWLLSVFPMALLEGPINWLTDTEVVDPLAPEFSAFVEGIVEQTEQGRFLLIPNMATHGVAFEPGDLVQAARTVLAGGVQGTLAAHPDDDRYVLEGPGTAELLDGPYYVTPPGETRRALGQLTRDGAQRVLTVSAAQRVALGAGQTVTLARAGLPTTFRLGARHEARFVVEGDPPIPEGVIQVRRAFPETSGFWGGLYDVMDFMTAGSMTKFLFSLTWGGAIELFGRIGYSLYRLFSDEAHFAARTGTDPRVLTFDGGRPAALAADARVLVVHDDQTAVRRIVSVTETSITVDRAVPYRAPEVAVYPYTDRQVTSDWDWHDYYPAEVEDLNRPTTVRVAAVNGERPTFAVFDRVLLASDTAELKTRVTSVGEDGLVELETMIGFDEDPPAPPGALRIAPSRLVDNFFLDLAERPGIRWLFDPYGLADPNRRAQPGDDPPRWASVLGQIARHLFGTRQWSALPAGGFYFWDNLPPQIQGEGFRSRMEQDASEESGDLYSPLARLRPNPESVRRVGDLGLYWYWPDGSRRTFSVYGTGLRDLAGTVRWVGDDFRPRVLPSRDAVSTDDEDPNGTLGAPAGTGLQLPDQLFEKSVGDPRQPAAADPASYIATPQGLLPASPLLERVSGHYVAFTEPADGGRSHRATVRNGAAGLDQARITQTGVSFGKRQPIFFDVQVQDVAVRFGVQTVAAGGTLTLVATQRLPLTVAEGDGDYVLVLEQPETGDVVRTDGARTLVAPGLTGTDVRAEVCRYYAFTPGADADDPVSAAMGGTYAEPRLAAHGVHVPQDLYVPVRRFTVRVVATLPLRRQVPTAEELAADLDVHAAPELARGGEAFVLIPVATGRDVGGGLEDVTVRQGGADLTDDQVRDAGLTLDPAVDVPASLRAYLGEDGVILRLAAADDADTGAYQLAVHTPAAGVDLTVDVTVTA